MSWKTIVVRETDRLFLKNNQLAFQVNEEIKTISIADINGVIFDNNRSIITTQLLSKLADANVFVMVCNTKHDPNGVFLPFNTHWKPLSVLHLQIKAKTPFKKRLWTHLVRAQILNAAIVLEKLKYKPEEVNKLRFLSRQLLSNDPTNCEARAARHFYRCIYGSNFIRFEDTGINSAINYGSKILTSAITRSLVKYGFQVNLGVNHCGEENPFNLSFDIVEPFRAIIHYFIKLMGETIGDSLLYNQRLELIEILNYRVKINEELRTVSDAIDMMAKSLLSAFKAGDSSKLLLPTIPYDDNKYYQPSDE